MTTLDLARVLGVTQWTVWAHLKRNPLLFGRVRRTQSGRFRINGTQARALAIAMKRDPRLLDDVV